MTMLFDEVLSTTKAVRQWLDLNKPVSRSLVMECCELSSYAPSSRNSQPFRFQFVDDSDKKQQIASLYGEIWDMYASPMYTAEAEKATTDKERQAIFRITLRSP